MPVGRDDSAFSVIERLFVMIGGPTGRRNPQRQGLNSALLDHLDPLHVIGGIPTIALDSSPMWDINLGQWTPNGVTSGYRSRLIDEFQLLIRAARIHHRSRRSAVRLGRDPGQLPDRAPVPVVAC